MSYGMILERRAQRGEEQRCPIHDGLEEEEEEGEEREGLDAE